MRGRVAALTLAVSLVLPVASTVAASPADAAPPGRCVGWVHEGGDWPSLNGDLANSRTQHDEDEIGPAEAAVVEPVWSFSASEVGVPGGMRTTPIVSRGCVYLAFGQGYLGDRGDVVALDADTGRVVWHTRLSGSILGLAVANGMVYATPSRGTRGEVPAPVVTDAYAPAGSHVVALDARTGARRWTSERLDDGNAANGTFVNASPVAYRAGGRRLLFVPLSGGSGDGARVPMVFLDARTGRTLARSFALTDEEYAEGFGGTGIWSTAAYDPRTRHLYAGTADSDARTRQHPYNNAILKIDADPRRRTFASVVDAYSGTSEHADLDLLVGDGRNPVCGASPAGQDVALPTFFDTSASVECLELDLDFGASPNLYEDDRGRIRVGALQKSGIYHAVDPDRMTRAWRYLAGPGGAAMSSATPAVADGSVFVGATPDLVHRVDATTGAMEHVTTTGLDLFAYQPLTAANGVLYAITDAGALVGFDASNGVAVLHRMLAVDGGFDQCLGVGAGVAVARHTIYAPCDAGGPNDLAGLPSSSGGVVAYRR